MSINETIGHLKQDKVKLAEQLLKKVGITSYTSNGKFFIFPPDNLSIEEAKIRAIKILKNLEKPDKEKVAFT
jgi:hypothetical protein